MDIRNERRYKLVMRNDANGDILSLTTDYLQKARVMGQLECFRGLEGSIYDYHGQVVYRYEKYQEYCTQLAT